MDKFSELVSKNIASFHHTPIAPEVPTLDTLCRLYNNIYSMILDTHMSPLGDGKYVITGHKIKDRRTFDQFLGSTTFSNVDVRRYGSPLELFCKCHLVGHYDVLNGDDVFILEPGEPKDVIPNTGDKVEEG